MPSRTPAILVVEDDPVIREIIRAVLTEGGLDVVATDQAFTALFEVKQRKFDLVVADINLPGELDGLGMVRRARHIDPGLKCLFISGWHEPVVCDPVLDDFISKPFAFAELLGCVLKVLSGNQPNPRLDIAKADNLH